MPTYEYACRACDKVFEVFQSMRDAPLTNCPGCGAAGVKRLIGRGSGLIFKGSGFYETDYKRPAEKQPASTEGSGGGEAAKPAAPTTGAAAAATPSGTPKTD